MVAVVLVVCLLNIYHSSTQTPHRSRTNRHKGQMYKMDKMYKCTRGRPPQDKTLSRTGHCQLENRHRELPPIALAITFPIASPTLCPMPLETSPYQDPRTFKMTPAMIRARKPFFARNMMGLAALLGVAGGVYYYTYEFLHKDNDFADVPIPPIDAKELEQLKKEYEEHKQQRDQK